jgi:CRP-like cAMP-binding protein
VSQSQIGLQLFRNAREVLPVPAGEAIFRQGDAGDAMFVVLEGEVDIVAGGQPIETVGAGGVFGEMALIDGAPRSASTVARTACRLVRIDETRFRFLVQQTPFFALQVMRIMAERLRRTTAAVQRGARD